MPGNNGSAHQLPRQRHAYHHRHQDPHHGHPHSHQHLQVGKGNGMNVSNYKLNCIELNRSLKAMQFVLENNMCKIVQRCLNFKSMIFRDASIWVEAQSVDPVWVKHWKMSETSELGKKSWLLCSLWLAPVHLLFCHILVLPCCFNIVSIPVILMVNIHGAIFDLSTSILKLVSAVLRCSPLVSRQLITS